MSDRNQYGLSRTIDVETKRVVRERCGFGCVICGSIPYDYDHFKIPFPECRTHDPDNIVLLCDPHHRKKTNGFISIDAIEAYVRNIDLRRRDASFRAELLSEDFTVKWPGIDITNCGNDIVIDGVPVLSIARTGNPLEPVLISGAFSNDYGDGLCRIERNEFLTSPAEIGDVECVANRLTLKGKSGRTLVKFSLSPKTLILEELYLVKRGAFVIADANRFVVGNGRQTMAFKDCRMGNSQTAVIVKSSGHPLVWVGGEIAFGPTMEMERMEAFGNIIAAVYLG